MLIENWWQRSIPSDTFAPDKSDSSTALLSLTSTDAPTAPHTANPAPAKKDAKDTPFKPTPECRDNTQPSGTIRLCARAYPKRLLSDAVASFVEGACVTMFKMNRTDHCVVWHSPSSSNDTTIPANGGTAAATSSSSSSSSSSSASQVTKNGDSYLWLLVQRSDRDNKYSGKDVSSLHSINLRSGETLEHGDYGQDFTHASAMIVLPPPLPKTTKSTPASSSSSSSSADKNKMDTDNKDGSDDDESDDANKADGSSPEFLVACNSCIYLASASACKKVWKGSYTSDWDSGDVLFQSLNISAMIMTKDGSKLYITDSYGVAHAFLTRPFG